MLLIRSPNHVSFQCKLHPGSLKIDKS